MKAVIEVDFKKINGIKITNENTSNRLIRSTKTTVRKTCDSMKKFFKDHNIDTYINYEIVIEDD